MNSVTFLSTMRTFFRRSRLLTLVLAVLAAILAAYILRWPLFGGIVRGAAVRALESSLGVRAEIGELSGSLIKDVHCRRIDATAADERAVVRAFRLEGLAIRYNFWRLLLGDLSALTLRTAGGELVLDADRPGVGAAPDADRRSEDFALPSGLPVLDLQIERLAVAQGGRFLELGGCVLRMGAPDPGGSQQGGLEAASVDLSSPEADGIWKRLRCPVRFSGGSRLAAGPLRIGEDGNLFQARAEFEDGDPAKVSAHVEAGLFGGVARLQAEVLLEGSVPLRAELEAEDVDAAGLGDWISRLADFDQPLWGSLSAEASLEGKLAGPILDTLTMRAGCRLSKGGFADVAPLEAVLEGGISDGAVSIERGRIDSGRSWIVVSEGSIPLRDGRLDMDAAAARFAFALSEATRWLELADVDAGDAGALAGARAEGEGRIAGRVVMGDRIRLDLESDTLTLEDARFLESGEGFRLDVRSLAGRLAELDVELLEPVSVALLPDRIETARLTLGVETSRLILSGRLDRDGTAALHASVSDAGRSLLSGLVPEGAAIESLDWDGLRAELDLSGPLSSPRVRVDCSIASFRYAEHVLDDVSVTARLDESRFDLDALNCVVRGGGRLGVRGGWDVPGKDPLALPATAEGVVTIEGLNLAALGSLWPPLAKAAGSLTAELDVKGSPADPACTLTARLDVLETPEDVLALLPVKDAAGSGPWALDVRLRTGEGALLVERLDLSTTLGAARASGRIPFSVGLSSTGFQYDLDRQGPVQVEVECNGLDLAGLAVDPALGGVLSLHGSL